VSVRDLWWKVALAGGVAVGIVAIVLALTRDRSRGVASPTRATPLLVGAVEDAALFGDPVEKMALARDAGFGAVVLSARWAPPLESPPADQIEALRAAAAAASADGIEPIVAVYQLGGVTPVDGTARAQFAAYAVAIVRALPGLRHLIVGNEPNLNLFWRPQFSSDGANASAPAYLRLLAETYDAVKAERPDVLVIGGGLASHGTDRPDGKRPTQSPTVFLRALGEGYRASGRDRPIMDMLSLHPYGESSSTPPDLAHPRSSTIGFADYDKLVAILGEAFDGTAQSGTSLPIVYGEYGIDTTVDANPGGYTGLEPDSVRPVDPGIQGERYAQAIHLAACQPTVRMLLLFHVTDEPQLDRLQTGVYWADDTPKPSLAVVREAIRATPAIRC
jgi:hypothetical protein